MGERIVEMVAANVVEEKTSAEGVAADSRTAARIAVAAS